MKCFSVLFNLRAGTTNSKEFSSSPFNCSIDSIRVILITNRLKLSRTLGEDIMVNDTQILNNGYPMPRLGLGVYKVTDEEMETAIQAALDDGYRAFDTAYFYNNEEALGKALKNSGVPREDLFITTKLWNDHQGYDSTLEYFNRSLNNLGLEYIDLYLIHWPCEKMNFILKHIRH